VETANTLNLALLGVASKEKWKKKVFVLLDFFKKATPWESR
jgi:hypothetical protein